MIILPKKNYCLRKLHRRMFLLQLLFFYFLFLKKYNYEYYDRELILPNYIIAATEKNCNFIHIITKNNVLIYIR